MVFEDGKVLMQQIKKVWPYFFASLQDAQIFALMIQLSNHLFSLGFYLTFLSYCLCNESKIHIFGKVEIENHLNIFIFAGFIFAIITPSRK
jgi:hypothetical protein